MATQNMLKCNTITALELDILKNDFEKASNNISHFHEIVRMHKYSHHIILACIRPTFLCFIL